MQTRIDVALRTVVALLVLSLAPVLSAGSVQDDPAERLVVSGPVVHSAAKYWTPERIKNAKPIDFRKNLGRLKLEPPAKPSGPSGYGESGLPGWQPRTLIEEIVPFLSTPNEAIGYSYPPPFTRYQNFDDYGTYPYAAVCKVLGHDPAENSDYVCSGSVWPNRSVVTAGHCVYNRDAHRFSTDVVVIPQYKNVTAPYGIFDASQLVAIQGYQEGNRAYDIALIQTANQAGHSISWYTGYLGVKYNGSYTQAFTIIGYPASRPFNGETQHICHASYAYTDDGKDPATVGVGCDLTGGSSGGPWIVKFSGKGGGFNLVNGVMSYGIVGEPKGSFSSYFGGAAKNLWLYARQQR